MPLVIAQVHRRGTTKKGDLWHVFEEVEVTQGGSSIQPLGKLPIMSTPRRAQTGGINKLYPVLKDMEEGALVILEYKTVSRKQKDDSFRQFTNVIAIAPVDGSFNKDIYRHFWLRESAISRTVERAFNATQ